MPDTPSKLTRYKALPDFQGYSIAPVPDETGDWVRYPEAAALEQRCRELEAENKRLRDACDRLMRLYVPAGFANHERAALSGAPSNGE